MSLKKNLYQVLFGLPEDNILEDQIPLVLSFSLAVFSLVGAAINLILGFSFYLVFAPVCAAIIMFFVYIRLRKAEDKFLYKVIMILFTYIYFNFLWFFNSASVGPSLFLFLLFFFFIMMIFERKSRMVFAGLLTFNILLLFLFEFFWEEKIPQYPDEKSRILDVYSSFSMYLAFSTILVLVVKY